ncbi:GNAT family N-acetyltransferase [Dyella mobilis]|uniref:GNAT family N-acetyltransferase n=2 Tax=Dyella mobilis TaxID=1849582 RepID=A0ABS2KHH5_9GAMM|nr:GNAT family N-acetyltransferase [Dyella mobilis]MBM7130623.1 GNAT family N-acetyltransferase [Dyella mobilis]
MRKATIKDAPTVFALRREAILAQCAGHYPVRDLEIWTSGAMSDTFARRVGELFYVADVEGCTAGSGMIDLSTGKIDAVFVRPDCMRRGVGRTIVDHLERLALRAGLSHVHLEATLNAAPFYRALGFQDEGERLYESSLGVSLACLAMSKPLQGG